MSKVYADKIEPRNSAHDVTIGTSTNTITLAGNDLRANTVKDSGGNTLWTSDGSGNLSSINSALAGNFKLLSTQTANGASSVSFTSGIDSTYDVYCFKFIDVQPSTATANFQFNCSTDGGSNYNVTKTTTVIHAYHEESDANSGLVYGGDWDLAQSTSYQLLCYYIGNSGDEVGTGTMYLFAPSSTTYIKHFYATTVIYNYQNASDQYAYNHYPAGYFNNTSAINAIDFKMSTGNINGIIKMYGLL